MGKFRSPITGYNHNVRHRGWVFHVQTEDSGVQNPHIFTHCFNGGVIVNTKKMVYDAIADAEVVKALMQAQHKSVLRELKKGNYDEKIDKYLGKAPEGADQGPEGPVAVGTPPPDGEAIETQRMPMVQDEILPERAGAPAQFAADGIPQVIQEEVTAANTADILLEADPPEGMEKAAERDRWQIREPAAVELPPPSASSPPATSWVVQRSGRPVETPFEASAAYRDDATPPPTRLQQPRANATVPPPAVTFSTPRGAAPVEARRTHDTEIPPPQLPDEPPSGAFTINNRARKSISADMMDGPTTNAGRTGPAPWDSASIPPTGPIKTRTIPPQSRPDPRHGDPRQNDARHHEPRNIDPRQEPPYQRDARYATSDPRHPDRQTNTPRGAPVRPAHVAPGARPQPPQNVIVSRPVVLGQREREAPAPPHGVRVPPARPTGQHSAPPSAVSEKSLDEVILAYLSEEAKGPK